MFFDDNISVQSDPYENSTSPVLYVIINFGENMKLLKITIDLEHNLGYALLGDTDISEYQDVSILVHCSTAEGELQQLYEYNNYNLCILLTILQTDCSIGNIPLLGILLHYIIHQST